MILELALLTFHNQHQPLAQNKFKNCIGDCQAIINPMVNLRMDKNSVFGGLNSIGELMIGGRRNIPINKGFDLTFGAYYQNNSKYENKGLTSPVFMGDFVPVAGIDIYRKNYGLVITPVVSSLYWRF
jgi:hypothetical protein